MEDIKPPTPGDKVVAIRNITDTHVYIFGYATYIGRENAPHGDDAKFRFENGEEACGNDIPLLSYESDFAEVSAKRTIEVVSLATERAMKERIHTFCTRLGSAIAEKVPGLRAESIALVKMNHAEAAIVGRFVFHRKMTATEIAEIDALTSHMTDRKKPS